MKIAEALVENTRRLTNKTRSWMEAHPNSPEPKNYSEYPGKMDHCTVMIMEVKCVTILYLLLITSCRNLEPTTTAPDTLKSTFWN